MYRDTGLWQNVSVNTEVDKDLDQGKSGKSKT